MNKDYAEKLAADSRHPVDAGYLGRAGRRLGDVAIGQAEKNCEAQREKYWSELKEHEKIDRLREVIKRLESRLELAEVFIRSLVEHKHAADGTLTGPFNPHNHMPQKYAQANIHDDKRGPDDIYF